MALTLEDQVLVWQRVEKALQAQNATKVAQEAFKALKENLVARGIAQLQFIPFSDISTADPGIDQDTGYSPIGAVASTVYALFVKKGSTATDSYVRLYNQTSNTTITLAFVSLILAVAGDEAFSTYPKGLIFGTDLTISADTGAGAGTESTAGDAGNGFVLIGA